jgi:hypothetical protein
MQVEEIRVLKRKVRDLEETNEMSRPGFGGGS